MMPSLRTAALSAAAVTALLAGCSSGSGTAGPTMTITTTPSTSSPPASAPASSPPVSPTSTPTTPACPTRSLGVSLGLSQGAAGTIYQNIDFKNISNVTCTLYGYPGVSLTYKKSGTQVQAGAPAVENTATRRETVTLAPGAIANALLRFTDAGITSSCAPVQADYLLVYPPNQTTPVYVKYSTTTCSKLSPKLLRIDAIRPGSGG